MQKWISLYYMLTKNKELTASKEWFILAEN